MKRFLAGLLFLSCACAAPAFSAEELTVSGRVDRSEVRQGEKLLFEITISGPIRESPTIRLDEWKAFRMVSTGQSQQVRMSGGEISQTLVLNYTLVALAAGTQTLGPVKVEYQGKVYETRPVEVKVLPGKKPQTPEKKIKPELPRLEGEVIL